MIRNHLGRIVLLSAFASLTACGGSDDPASPQGGPGDPPPPPPPVAAFSLAVSTDKTVISQGSNLPVTVTVTREAGFTGAVSIAAAALPQGVSTPAIVIPADASSVVVNLAAAAAAPHSLPTATEIKGSAGDLLRSTALTVTVRGVPGAVDTSFAAGRLTSAFSAADDYVEAMAQQSDGKIVVVGHTAVPGHGVDFAVARFTRDGEPDASFGTAGKLTTSIADGSRTDDARAVAVDAQGKILVAGGADQAGSGLDFALVRYNADGSLDTTFGSGGKVTTAMSADADRALAILVQLDGKIVLGGESNQGAATTGQDFALVRYNNNGSLDTTFGNGGKVLTAIASAGGKDSIHALVRQVVGGEERIVAVGGESDFVMARYLANGQLDPSFGNGGTIGNLLDITVGSANAAVVDENNKLVVVGHSMQNVAVVRLNADGSFDTSFGNGGKIVRDVSATDWDQATSVALQSDGKIVVGGWAFADDGPRVSNFVLLRYSAAGVPDDSFGNAGTVVTVTSPKAKNNAGRAMLLQADPRVPTVRAIQAGEAADGANDFAIVRYWL